MKNKKKTSVITAAITVAALSGGLVNELIINDLDWEPLANHPNPIVQEVAPTEVHVTVSGNRCNGSMIAPGILFTNNHCVPEAGLSVYISNLDFGGKQSYPELIRCGDLLHTSKALDYSLVDCSEADYPAAVVDLNPIELGDDIFIVHQQCHWAADAFCKIRKLVSFGRILEVTKSFMKHDADTLGGSSGSPIYRDGKIVAIHNSGYGNWNHDGQGEWNGGVNIRSIIKDMPTVYRDKVKTYGRDDIPQTSSQPFIPSKRVGGHGTIGGTIKKKSFWKKVKCFFSRKC